MNDPEDELIKRMTLLAALLPFADVGKGDTDPFVKAFKLARVRAAIAAARYVKERGNDLP